MRLRLVAAAVLAAVAAAAACSAARPEPSVRAPVVAPVESRPLSVELTAAREWLENHAFRCASRTIESGVAVRCVVDERSSRDGAYLVVDLLGSPAFVALIEATMDASAAEEPRFDGFGGFYGDTVLGLLPDRPAEEIDAWLRDHLTTSGTTETDGLVLEMTVDRTRSTLRVWQRR